MMKIAHAMEYRLRLKRLSPPARIELGTVRSPKLPMLLSSNITHIAYGKRAVNSYVLLVIIYIVRMN